MLLLPIFTQQSSDSISPLSSVWKWETHEAFSHSAYWQHFVKVCVPVCTQHTMVWLIDYPSAFRHLLHNPIHLFFPLKSHICTHIQRDGGGHTQQISHLWASQVLCKYPGERRDELWHPVSPNLGRHLISTILLRAVSITPRWIGIER